MGAFRRVIFAFPNEEVPARVILGFQEEFKYPEINYAPCAPKADQLVVLTSPSDPHLSPGCLDVDLRKVLLNFVRGRRVQIFITAIFRENQLWRHLPCGRIVLDAFPQLCLSAAQNHNNAHIHIWYKTEKNQHLQIWEKLEDGSICLKIDQSKRLSVSRSHEVLLSEKVDDRFPMIVQCYEADPEGA